MYNSSFDEFFIFYYYIITTVFWGWNMNFSYQGADTSKIIKKYKKDGHIYTIEYMNGDISSFCSTDENSEQKIIDTMVDQIIERQDKININLLNNIKNLGLCTSLFSVASLYANFINDKKELLLFPVLGLIIGIKIYNDQVKNIHELKKYKMFLEMTNNSTMRIVEDKWLDYIELDKSCQIPLNINTIDDYSYKDIKLLSKKMKEKKNDIYKK